MSKVSPQTDPPRPTLLVPPPRGLVATDEGLHRYAHDVLGPELRLRGTSEAQPVLCRDGVYPAMPGVQGMWDLAEQIVDTYHHLGPDVIADILQTGIIWWMTQDARMVRPGYETVARTALKGWRDDPKERSLDSKVVFAFHWRLRDIAKKPRREHARRGQSLADDG